VDPCPGRQLLSQQAECHLCDDERIVRVDAHFRIRSRVRRLPLELDVAVCDSVGPGVGRLHGTGVSHHREVQPLKRSALEQLDLAASASSAGAP
jgi:hypothetical protein